MRSLHASMMVAAICSFLACGEKKESSQEMIALLKKTDSVNCIQQNPFCPEAKFRYYDSLLSTVKTTKDSMAVEYFMANTLLKLGDEERAIGIDEYLLQKIPAQNEPGRLMVLKDLAIAYLRYGERMNCINSHSGESCIFPVKGKGVHYNQQGSQKAIAIFTKLLDQNADDLESRWLLNIAYMTIGRYPQSVPAAYLIRGLDADTVDRIKPFVDLAPHTGLNTKTMAGGSIVDDFDNDGYLDIVTSGWGLKEGMHYCRSNANGIFTDRSDASGLQYLTGGLNIMQTDYNNDGFKDIFVLRGAWMKQYGKQPNSLLRNNGDGTFTDVTARSGLLSFHPTQAATWADFNNDGWLDVFIGNETADRNELHPCELYINKGDGTFEETAAASGCNIIDFVKGVTSGDYDNDGLPDIFISTLTGNKILFKNKSKKNGAVHFEDVSARAGLTQNRTGTFPTWFWDYDNDGWLDIMVSGYEYMKPLAAYSAAAAMGQPADKAGRIFLYRNKHDGTFEDVSEKTGLNKIVFAMGANFGDIDNDGYLDMYFGTGNPLYQSLIPNKLFRNVQGQRFADVTTSGRVGNLQKGHGVSIADVDNDGDEDIFITMGGAYIGDAYEKSLYINPGQNNNHWLNISLEGKTCNRAAIGTRIKVTFLENGRSRSVYRWVNSGGSFGSNPLRQHFGIGSARNIQSVEILWAGSQTAEVFRNIAPNTNIRIREGDKTITTQVLRKTDLLYSYTGLIGCAAE